MNQWVQAIDPVSGQVYYANCSTGETSWFPPPPPPHDVAAQQQNHHNNVVIGQAAAHNNIPPTAQLQQQHSQPLTTQQNTNEAFLNSSNSVTYQLDPSTATTPGLLLPSIRAIIDKEQAQKMSIGRKIELEGVSAGTIADLCNVSREWRSRNVRIDGGDFAEEQNASTPQHGQNENESSNIENEEAANYYYMPLQPFSLPLQSRPPHIEPGRVDIRMHALYSKLRSFAEENSV
jgi:hypothetical protein